MRVGQSGANLFQIMHGLLDGQLAGATKHRQISAAQILEHYVMKRFTGKIDGRAMTEAVNNVRMAHPVERYCLVLKILDQGALELYVRHALEQDIQRFDND